MWEKIELLEYHACFPTDFKDTFHVIRELNSIHEDLPLVVLFQSVKAPYHRRLTGTGGATYDNFFTQTHRKRDILQGLESTEILGNIRQLYDDLGFF